VLSQGLGTGKLAIMLSQMIVFFFFQTILATLTTGTKDARKEKGEYAEFL
jgi:hypothetical protein